MVAFVIHCVIFSNHDSILMSATKNKHSKVALSCRLSPLVKALINLERESGGHPSEGEAVEALVLRASNTSAAHQLVLAQAEKDPMYAALRNALSSQQTGPGRVNSSSQHFPDSNRHAAELAAVVNPFSAPGAKSGSAPKAKRPRVSSASQQ